MPDIFSYNATMAPAFEGMIAETQFKDATSRRVETAAGIGFGLAVTKGTADAQVRLGGTVFVGITVADHGQPGNRYEQNAVAACLRRGTIWVKADGAVTAGSPVTYTTATGLVGQRAVAAGIVAVPDAIFETSGASGDLVRVYLG